MDKVMNKMKISLLTYDMQLLRPDMELIPDSECEWLCRGLGDSGPGEAVSSTRQGGAGPASRLLRHQLEMDLRLRSRLRWRDCC